MGRDEINKLVKKVEDFKEGVLDLSTDEDLSIALMNLVSIEEHMYFSYVKTDDDKYLDMLDLVRRTRIKYLKEIVVDPKGEEWCISKHLLSSSMRLIEVANKLMSRGSKEKAKDLYDSAFDLYSLFFGINHKDLNNIKNNKSVNKTKDKTINQNDYSNLNIAKNSKKEEKKGKFSSFKSYLKEKLDCCREL